jgi:hypothetical protein
MRKPMFLAVLFHVTVVPTFMQNAPLLLAFGMLAVEDAPSRVRLTSTVQGVAADPQVLLALHCCTEFGSEQAYLPLTDWAVV